MDFLISGDALIATLLVMGVSLAGVLFSKGQLGGLMQRYTTYFATFSAGVFILVAYHLAKDAIHDGGWIWGIAAMLLGAALMEGIHYVFPMQHHHHDISHDHAHTPIDGRKVILSDALHNISDGILLVGAFAADFYIGVAAAVGVVIHETVQEISEYFVLREAGYTNSEALIRNFAASSTILIGFLFTSILSSHEIALALLSGLAAGGFLSVVLHDLVPHAVASTKAHGGTYAHALAAFVGGAMMFGIQIALPHEEPTDSSRISQEIGQQSEEKESAQPTAPTNTVPETNQSTHATVTGTPKSTEATTSPMEGVGSGGTPEPPVSESAASSEVQSTETGGVPGAR